MLFVTHDIDEAIFTTISNDATRVAALLSGEVDWVDPVPLQDQSRVSSSANAVVVNAPELRTIYLGMDQTSDELRGSNVKGKNPFKDVRVRQAFQLAIDVNALRTQVMRGLSIPTGVMFAPQSDGYDKPLVWMEKEKVYKVTLQPLNTSNWFAPGHRIRIEVSSSNFPRFDRNLNTGGDNEKETRFVVANNAVHHAAGDESYIELPVVTKK